MKEPIDIEETPERENRIKSPFFILKNASRIGFIINKGQTTISGSKGLLIFRTTRQVLI